MKRETFYKFPNFYAAGYWFKRIAIFLTGVGISYGVKCLLVFFGII